MRFVSFQGGQGVSGGKNTVARAGRGGVRVALMLAPTLLLVVIGLMGLFPGLVWPGVQAVVDWFF